MISQHLQVPQLCLICQDLLAIDKYPAVVEQHLAFQIEPDALIGQPLAERLQPDAARTLKKYVRLGFGQIATKEIRDILPLPAYPVQHGLYPAQHLLANLCWMRLQLQIRVGIEAIELYLIL